MSTFAVSDAVLDAYLTQARRDVEQGDIEGISLPVRAMAAILDECSRWRHGEFWDTATAFKSRAEAAEAELAAARAENERLRDALIAHIEVWGHDTWCSSFEDEVECDCSAADLRALLDEAGS